MSVIEIKNQCLTVGIQTLGAELVYVRDAEGRDYLWDGDPAVWRRRSPLLFPICGGLKEDTYTLGGKAYHLPKHGFTQDSEFVGRAQGADSAEFILTDNEQTRAAYPFSFCLRVRYTLLGARLCVTYEVENRSSETMYFSIGAHEGYACPEGIEEYDVVFDTPVTLDTYVLDGNIVSNKTERVLENGRVFPLRYSYFAMDALVFKHIPFRAATLAHRYSGKRIRVEFPDADYFLLWTKPQAKYICLEPWLGIPDGEGSGYAIETKEGIRTLEAGKSYVTRHTVTFETVEDGQNG